MGVLFQPCFTLPFFTLPFFTPPSSGSRHTGRCAEAAGADISGNSESVCAGFDERGMRVVSDRDGEPGPVVADFWRDGAGSGPGVLGVSSAGEDASRYQECLTPSRVSERFTIL
jgi:hypothetical protein